MEESGSSTTTNPLHVIEVEENSDSLSISLGIDAIREKELVVIARNALLESVSASHAVSLLSRKANHANELAFMAMFLQAMRMTPALILETISSNSRGI